MAVDGSHAADVEFLVRRSMTKGYQLFSLLSPPAYVAFIFARKGRAQFSINRFLRATWVGGAVGKLLPSVFFFPLAHAGSGCAAGGGFEYVRSANSSEVTVRNRHIRSAYDVRSPFNLCSAYPPIRRLHHCERTIILPLVPCSSPSSPPLYFGGGQVR